VLRSWYADAPAPGITAHFSLAQGDSYTGVVVAIRGDLVTLQNYSAWYEGDDSPYDSPYFDDAVSFRIDAETRVSAF
jgi:hypothetical protein